MVLGCYVWHLVLNSKIRNLYRTSSQKCKGKDLIYIGPQVQNSSLRARILYRLTNPKFRSVSFKRTSSPKFKGKALDVKNLPQRWWGPYVRPQVQNSKVRTLLQDLKQNFDRNLYRASSSKFKSVSPRTLCRTTGNSHAFIKVDSFSLQIGLFSK